MEILMLTFLQIIVSIVGIVAIGVSAFSICKGPMYIAAANFGWGDYTIRNAFQGKPISKIIFRLTPFSLVIVFGWAGYSILYDLFWFLGDAVFFDKEVQEWTSYRSWIASVAGVLVGASFAFWVFRVCEASIKANEKILDISAQEQLQKIVFG